MFKRAHLPSLKSYHSSHVCLDPFFVVQDFTGSTAINGSGLTFNFDHKWFIDNYQSSQQHGQSFGGSYGLKDNMKVSSHSFCVFFLRGYLLIIGI